tara:strand:+ start:973 stop:1329 length:357 start_codon:yes stop_codon:yes gene_type:complete
LSDRNETEAHAPPSAPQSVMVCINRRFRGDQPSCAARGSEAVADAIEAGIAARRIDIKMERVICLGQCTKGPTVRFAPGGRFNLGTCLEDVPAILDELQALCGVDDDESGPPMHLLGS